MTDKSEKKSSKPSGYAEDQPKSNSRSHEPDAKTPHEPQNVPTKKPKTSS